MPSRGTITRESSAYDGAPPKITLSALEYDVLEDGEAVHKSIDVNGMVGAVAVFRISAPPATVWSVLSEFGSYPEWIDGLVESDIYRREGDDIYVKFRGLSEFPNGFTNHFRLMQ